MTNMMTAYWEDFQRDLAELIAIESVAVPGGVPPIPYGVECSKALDWMLNKADKMGLRTVNLDGYAGYAEWGDGDEYCAVLTHIDVVPAGLGWTDNAFKLTERNGNLYGRGTVDDKGAALAALYCLWRLKENGIAGKRRVRVIFGCGEERGMEDMKYYFSREPLPELAFTPDSDYTVCNREKGILQLKGSGSTENMGVLESFCAGAAVNAVPDYAEAELRCTSDEWNRLIESSSRHDDVHFEIEQDGMLYRIKAYGKGSHAMCPEDGINAAARLITLLYSVFETRIGTMAAMLYQLVGLEYNGKTLGIACSDIESGALTCNLSTVTLNKRCNVFSMDIRYPVSADGEEILRALSSRMSMWGIEISIIHHIQPVYMPADSTLVKMLSEVYEQITGTPAHIYATGGGTYARMLGGRGLAFGPVFPGQDDPAMHKPDEHIEIARFKEHMEICYEAMRCMFVCD